MKRIHNFSAGPAVLPESVIEEVKQDLFSFQGSGIGIMEMSHRSSLFDGILDEVEQSFKILLNLPANYKILFCTGGATQQFSMLALNLSLKDKPANYIVSGEWAKKAYQEAKRFVDVHIAGSSEEIKFKNLPKQLNLTPESSYLHFTSNNTLYGTQYKSEPESGNHLLVCDASSDFLHKPLDLSKYGLIYASSQKNLGPAGVTVVIIREDLLERTPNNLALNLDYKLFAKNRSLYNTPPTFPIYVMGKVLKWLINSGGLEKRQLLNAKKAQLLYDFIDNSKIYHGVADKECRSVMNVTFRMKTEEMEKDFLNQAEASGFSGLTGHRSVGGVRASIYNAFPVEGIAALIEFMKDFEKKQ